MKQWSNVDEVLDFAIGNEQEAHDFYVKLAGEAEKPWMKAVFEGFAKEELGHKKKLQGVKQGKLLAPAAQKITDLKIADYLVDVEPTGKLDYQQALIVAMKKEKAAFRLYSDLAATMEGTDLEATFLALAQEEAKHKLRFEVEYDDYVLTDN